MFSDGLNIHFSPLFTLRVPATSCHHMFRWPRSWLFIVVLYVSEGSCFLDYVSKYVCCIGFFFQKYYIGNSGTSVFCHLGLWNLRFPIFFRWTPTFAFFDGRNGKGAHGGSIFLRTRSEQWFPHLMYHPVCAKSWHRLPIYAWNGQVLLQKLFAWHLLIRRNVRRIRLILMFR